MAMKTGELWSARSLSPTTNRRLKWTLLSIDIDNLSSWVSSSIFCSRISLLWGIHCRSTALSWAQMCYPHRGPVLRDCSLPLCGICHSWPMSKKWSVTVTCCHGRKSLPIMMNVARFWESSPLPTKRSTDWLCLSTLAHFRHFSMSFDQGVKNA